MHPNWRIIGTMNVYDKSQLFYMSFAFMRRFAFVDVGLPDEDKIYKDLRHDWLDKRVQLRTGQEPPQEQIDLLKAKMDALFRPDSDLMKRRALGPAIALDMTKYIADRYQNPMGEIDPLSFLGEAFLLYAAPQLDGLDRQGITNIYQEIKDMFTIKDEAGQEKEVAEPILARIRSLYPHMTEKDWEEKSK
jgi:hypothetical protein